MVDKKPLLMLIDGYGLIFRAYYTIHEMSYHDFPTNALYGFVAMILKLMETKPDALLIALDHHGEKERQKEFVDYKANRDEAPDNLKIQIARLRDLISQMGICWIEKEGEEADDVIGSLAKKAVKDGYEVQIVSGDMDLSQLVDDHIKLLYTIRGTTEFKIYDKKAVIERFGVEPPNVVDYKGLVGDPSDNIPGVKGVGEKTAKKLLMEFGSIDGIFANIDKVKPDKTRENLLKHKDNAYMSRNLATIHKDLDITLPQKSHEFFDPESAQKIFSELGFRSFIERLKLKTPVGDTPDLFSDKSSWKVIQSLRDLDKLIDDIKAKGEFAIDLETTSLDARRTDLVGIAIAIDDKEGYYIPVGHLDSSTLLTLTEQKYQNLPIKDVLAKLKPIIESEKIKKVAQNAKFEILALANQNLDLKNVAFDTFIASYVLNPDSRHNLKELGLKWMDRHMQPIDELIGSGKKQISMCEVPIEKVAPYAVDDATVTWGLKSILSDELKKAELENLYYTIELPLITLLAEMERDGIRIDDSVLKQLSVSLQKDLNDLAERVHQIVQKDINLNSPKQLSILLFDELRLPNIKKGSTNIEVLEEIKDVHPIVPLIIEHRSVMKLRSTYTEGLLAVIDPKDGRIHTNFNQTLTSTGRLSSSDPNLQNIPIRTERGREIRKAFLPNHDDEVLLSADYSQIELRLLAHYSKDEALIETFMKGQDIHERTAREILPIKDGIVTPNDRRMAKVVNFGIIYGMSAFSLSKDLGISRQQAQSFIDSYFARYPRVKEFFKTLLDEARTKGYVQTFMGRRRYMTELNSQNQLNRSNAERAAQNMPLQGGAADIMKKAMIELREKLIFDGFSARIILQVHDEILLTVKEQEINDVINITQDTLSNTCKLNVPLVVNMKKGKNWLDLEDIR